MKLAILLAIASSLCACAGPRLMKCPDEAPENIYHCEDHIYHDYYMCKVAPDLFVCVPLDDE